MKALSIALVLALSGCAHLVCMPQNHSRMCISLDPKIEGITSAQIEALFDRAAMLVVLPTDKQDNLIVDIVHHSNWDEDTTPCPGEKGIKNENGGTTYLAGCTSKQQTSHHVWMVYKKADFSICNLSRVVTHELIHVREGADKGHEDQAIWGPGGEDTVKGIHLSNYCNKHIDPA